MDYEDVINMTNYANTSEPITPERSRKDISHEIVFLICCTIAFIADVLIIFTILRFKQMRNVRNLFIANWAAIDVCSLVVTPTGYRILSIFSNFSISSRAKCILFELGAASHYMVIICVFIVLLDWFIAAYFLNASRKIRSYHKIFLGLTWGVFILIVILYCYGCKNGWYNYFLHTFATFFTLCGVTLFIIILHIINGVQKCRKKPLEYPKLGLHLGTCFIMCYIMAVANIFLVDFLRMYHPFFAIISACFVFCNGIANLIVLYFCDTHFQAHFLQVIKCKFDRYNNQISELDDHFSEVSFHSPTEQLINSA